MPQRRGIIGEGLLEKQVLVLMTKNIEVERKADGVLGPGNSIRKGK